MKIYFILCAFRTFKFTFLRYKKPEAPSYIEKINLKKHVKALKRSHGDRDEDNVPQKKQIV